MMTKIFGIALLVGSMSGQANAANWGGFWEFDHHNLEHRGGSVPPVPAPPSITAPSVSAPEIDPASAMSALTMLASGLVIMRGRRSKQ